MRVICHIDLDAFYVQVERVLQRVPLGPTEPCAVVQYNEFAGGGIIALSYEAKRMGVKRNMRGDEARRICPEIKLVTVPVAHEKADLTIYRDAGTEVFELLDRQGAVCERTSIDEAYVDISKLAAELAARGGADPPTEEDLTGCHVLGIDDSDVPSWVRHYTESGDQNAQQLQPQANAHDDTDEYCDTILAAGAVVAARLRALVKRETRYTMSAGVAQNKLLAKHASGMHKPYAQTVVTPAAVPGLMASIDISNLNGLGGKKGEAMKQAHEGLSKIADLQRFTREQLARDFPGTSPHSAFISWLYDACRGVCHKPVERRLYMDSVGNSKTFRGPAMLTTLEDVRKYLELLSEEVWDRLQTYKTRYGVRPSHASVYISQGSSQVTRKGEVVSVAGGEGRSASRSFPLAAELASAEDLAGRVIATAESYLTGDLRGRFEITALGVTTSKQVPIQKKGELITSFFNKGKGKKTTTECGGPAVVRGHGSGSNAATDDSSSTQERGIALSAPKDSVPPTTEGVSISMAVARPVVPDAHFATGGGGSVEDDAESGSGWVCDTCTFRNEGDDWLQCSVCLAERNHVPKSDRTWHEKSSSASARTPNSSKSSQGKKRKAVPPATTPLTAFLSKRSR